MQNIYSLGSDRWRRWVSTNISNIIEGTSSQNSTEQVEFDLSTEVQERINGDANLQNQINTVVSGYLGPIDYNASVPTPAKNGWYDFSTEGVVSWLDGTPTVKIGDRVSVLYTNPTYIYTYQNINVGDLGNRVADLEVKIGQEVSTSIPDLSGIFEYGGDNIYYTLQDKVQLTGILSTVTVKVNTGGILKVQAVSISNGTVILLHQYEDIQISTGTNTYTLTDKFIIPENSYIGIFLSSSPVIGYNHTATGVFRYANGIATPSSIGIGVNYTIATLGEFVNYTPLDTFNALASEVTYLIGNEQAVGLPGSTGTFNASGGDNAYYTCQGVVPIEGILNKISVSTDTDGGILKYQAVSVSGTSVTILHQFDDIILSSGTNTYNVNDSFILPIGTYISVLLTVSANISYNNSGTNIRYQPAIEGETVTSSISSVGVGVDYTIKSLNSVVDVSQLLSKANHGYIAGDVVKTLKEVETEVINIFEQNAAPNRKMRKLALFGKNVILYGDSISSTDYPWYVNSMAELTSATVYSGGFSGYNTSALATNACIQRIYDYNPDLIICLVGGNDTGIAGSVGTFGTFTNEPTVSPTNIANDYNGTYFIQAVDHIMRKVKDYYYNIRLRANLTGSETESEKTAKIDALPKPYFVFCTTLAQKRSNDLDEFSQKVNWERKRNAVIEACNKNDVHCVDLYNLTGFDMTLEPYWIGPTDTTHNNGVYTMDGLHPNKYGFQVISEIICGDIGIK